jgi:dipeptidyl aminopeptidase/acylaminoacyl peptidase
MKCSAYSLFRLAVTVLLLAPATAGAQGTAADYDRALALRGKYLPLALNVPEPGRWVEKTHRYVYRRTVRGGHEFVQVNADEGIRSAPFDHERIAAALSKASGGKYTGLTLPFTTFTFAGDGSRIEFAIDTNRWGCDLSAYRCAKVERPVPERRDNWGRGPHGDPDRPKISPDGKWEALVNGYNVYLRQVGTSKLLPLSFDGSEGNYYSGSIAWSPDSTKLVTYRVRPGYRRVIQYVESSPADQLQPRYSTREYAKPGDELDADRPVIFDVAARCATAVDDRLFPNAYDLTNLAWRKDSRHFTFEYNQRGHQVYRVIEVDAASGTARAAVSEEPKTFFSYSGKKYRYDVHDGKEIVWMSERDGWNHLYLIDGETGAVKQQITKGPWVVRGVDRVDESARRIWFRASGMYPGKDPYFVHFYRIDFDGNGLTALTESEDAQHAISLSADGRFFVDTWSRIDVAPVSVLRQASDGKVVIDLERADIGELRKAGWRPPESFTATGRDGKTDIWGVIFKPSNFDPSRKYPVIEQIYAGPHDSFVPKVFSAYSAMQAQAELGFIVVQIDGMGTSNRSKAFHDVCWKNLADGGFPDRILWHKAAAAKYRWYDATRVGIYGHSAGGQNALAALLFHPEFYKAAVSSCGCHDNRMDKIWWNEQWMGWPLGPEYAASSNVDNAWRLKGRLLLSVGEMDDNVDPASTMQVVNALVEANKVFDLLVLPGQRHSAGGVYGERKRYDFFVRHLLGVEPPDWNAKDADPS